MTVAWLLAIGLAATHVPYDVSKQSTMLVLGEFAQSVSPKAGEPWPTDSASFQVRGRHWDAEEPAPAFRLVRSETKRGKEFAEYEVTLRGTRRSVELVRP